MSSHPLVYAALREGRFAEAEQHALALLKRAPRDPEAHRAHAATMQMTGRVDQAILSMRTAVALAPDSAPLRLALGQVLGSAGRIEAAIAAFGEAAALQPDAVDAWYLLGTTLYGAGRDAEAADALRRAHALRPAQPEIARALAEADYMLERFADALRLFESLLPVQAADPMLWLRRSQCRRRDGAPEDALRVAEEALPLDLFLGDLASSKPHRVAGTAVFMTSNPEGAPPVLLHHFKHNKVLHEQVVLLSIATRHQPEIPRSERIEYVRDRGAGIFQVSAGYGFMQTPNVQEVLELCETAGLKVNHDDTSFFLGRETLLVTSRRTMASWRKHLFVFMSKNARPANAFFRIPPNRVVELGTQIEL